MMADHLHAASLTLREDSDFGPLVMSRCALEAAGRAIWVLSGETVRDRVTRSVAVRVRGLRDMERTGPSLREAYPDDERIPASLAATEARTAEALAKAAALRLPVEWRDRMVTGLKVGVPDSGELTYLPLKHLDIPVLAELHGQWSAAAHSTYDAIRAAFTHVDMESRQVALRHRSTTACALWGSARTAAPSASIRSPLTSACLDIPHVILTSARSVIKRLFDLTFGAKVYAPLASRSREDNGHWPK